MRSEKRSYRVENILIVKRLKLLGKQVLNEIMIEQ